MTIAIAIKINNGLVLATDSAAVIGEVEENQTRVHHTYYNADKLFNLKKGESIGCLTWGAGSIGGISISTLTKDFRDEIKDMDKINVKEIAEKFSDFLKKFLKEKDDKVDVGFLIAGYSNDNGHKPEMYNIEIEKGNISKMRPFATEDTFSISWLGGEDYLSRLIIGVDPRIEAMLTQEGFTDEETAKEIFEVYKRNFAIPVGTSEMPIQDAIDLARFLVYVSENLSMFSPGPQAVGGPIDIAVITKHEGFKWIQRKHYYTQELNINNSGGS